jgi:PAS domain S-box-containing protein
MKNEDKTKNKLIKELKQHIAKLEASETKYQLIEEALKKKTLDLDEILTNLKQGIAYLDVNDEIIYSNKQCSDLFGLRYKDVIRKNIYEFHLPENKRKVKMFINEFRKGNQSLHFIETVNDRFIDNTFYRIQDADGNYKGIVMSSFDITDRKQAEDARKESEEKFRTFMERASDLMYMTDSDGNLAYVNDAMANTLGWTKEEMIGIHITQLVSKESLQPVGKRRGEIIEKGKLTHETIWITKKGKEVYGENKIVAFYDSVGKYVGGRGVFRDITKRKKAEKALKKSEEKFRTFMESASDLMYMTDSDANLTYVNEAMANTLGWTKEEMIGMDLTQVINKESLEKDIIAKVKKEVIKKGKLSFEDIWITKDGKEVNGENKIVAIYDNDGNFLGTRGVFRDITKRKKAEKALKESEEKFRTFMESASDLMHIVDKDGNFIYVNKAMCKALGYTRKKLLRMNITQILHKEYLVRFGSRRKELIKKGQISLETTWITKNGKEIYCEVKVVAIYDNDGNFLGNSAVVRDITERNKMEQELEVRASNLDEVNTALRVLLKRREEDKTELEDKVLFSMKEMALPYLEKLNESGLNERQKNYADLLESSLKEITAPFLRTMSIKYSNLTPREFQVVDFIMKNQSTKGIAKLLNVSLKTIETYRFNIRTKLGIKNKKINLKMHLSSIQ